MDQFVSVIICSHNGSKCLPETLNSLKAQEVPDDLSWEVIIIDNASTDGTGEIAQSVWGELPGVTFRVLPEPKIGLSYARNRGLQEAHGDLICFTDDDTRPHPDWLRSIVDYAAQSDSDAIAGKVILPEGLCRPWMQKFHRTKLASTENIDRENPQEMIGANMAFRRRVLAKVPQFDPELGAGASGFSEESLFSMQLLEAGFSIGYAEKAVVEHHFEPRRLLRMEWLKGEQKRGSGYAYIAYHWEHKNLDVTFTQYIRIVFRLLRWRMTHKKEMNVLEGCSFEEMKLVRKISYYKRYQIEKKKLMKYHFHGLNKLY